MGTGEEDECELLKLSHNEVSIVTHELCDPLQPLLAVHLSSTAKGLREAMEEQLAELKQQTQQAAALAALCEICLLYTSPSPRDRQKSRMPSSA